MALSVGMGYLVGRVLNLILSIRLGEWAKIALVLLSGFLVFDLSRLVRQLTHAHLQVEILLEPLLICMVASFFVTNFSRYRVEFLALVEPDGLTIGFNPEFLVDALKVCEETVTLKLSDSAKPGLLTSGTNFTYIVMPVNLS